MSFRGVNSANNTIQVWNGTRWVPFSSLTFTESGGNATLATAAGSINITATGGPLALSTNGAASLTSTGSSATLSGTTASVTATSGAVTITSAGNFSITAPTTVINGNLEVIGNTTTIDSQTVNVKDAYLALGIGYSTVGSGRPSGLVEVRQGVVAVFGTNITAFPSTTTASVTSDPGLAAGSIIQIQGAANPANNGLFEYAGWSGGVMTIGAGVIDGGQVLQNAFVVDTGTNTATLQHVNISSIRARATAGQEIGDGSNVSFTYSPVGTGAGNNLQQAYDVAPGIVTTANGAVTISTALSSDALDVSASSTGNAVVVSTSGVGHALVSSSTGAGDALRVQANVLRVTGAGAVISQPTSGQNFTVTTAAAGVASMSSATTAVSVGSTLTFNGGSGVDTWPATQGTNGQVLSTTGSGALVWAAPASGYLVTPYTASTGALNLTSQAAALEADEITYAITTDTGLAVTLPTPEPAAGTIVRFKDKSGTAATNNVTISATNGLDGAGPQYIATNYGALTFQSLGSGNGYMII